MPQTTQCKSCGIILNLPDRVPAGKRLRCPKCGLRFVVTVSDASSESTLAAPTDAEATFSAFNLPRMNGNPDDLPLPVSTGDRDLRETFELPLMNTRDAEREGVAPSAAVS